MLQYVFSERHILWFFCNEYISQQVLHKTEDKAITNKIFRIQDNEYIMCRFYCMTFINNMLAGKSLWDYTNLFSTNGYYMQVF